MSQCNPKCPFCDGVPREGEDILKFDWEHFVSEGGKLVIAPYSTPSSKTTRDGQALFDALFAGREKSPIFQAPRTSDRFMWIHKKCVEKVFEICRSVHLKVAGAP